MDSNLFLSRIEARQLWAFFHKDWLLQLRVLIRPQLPQEYYLFVESETIVISPEENRAPGVILPDVSIARSSASERSRTEVGASEATAAVVDVEEVCEVFGKYSLLIRRAPENQVVAALEILSPSNKGLGNRLDLDAFLRKRSDYLQAGVNLLEIDALREGERRLQESLQELSRFPRIAWSAFHREGRRRLRGWGWSETDPLPTIPWTVEANLDVLVDLGLSLDQACEFNRWEALVRSSAG